MQWQLERRRRTLVCDTAWVMRRRIGPKEIHTVSDECGNSIEVEQVLLIEDNDAPFWLEEPSEQIFTDNIDGEIFDALADDVCSNFEVDMTTSMRRVVPSVCGDDAHFRSHRPVWKHIGTIHPGHHGETDLTMSQPSTTPVSCNGGSDGTVEVTYSGGVGPYTVDWGGYNPDALPAGEYTWKSWTRTCAVKKKVSSLRSLPHSIWSSAR